MKSNTTFFWLLAFLCSSFAGWSQTGGDDVFEFLQISPTARITGLGGSNIANVDNDPGMGFLNPSLINEQMHQRFTIAHNFQVSDISNSFVNYTHHLAQANMTLQGGLHFMDYGQFQGRDEYETPTQTFNASEYAAYIGVGRTLYEKMRVGARLTFIGSQLEQYSANGLALDLGTTYIDTARLLSIAFVAKNMGLQMKKYHPDATRGRLPFEMQIGLTKRLRYLPFQLNVTYGNLQQWNVLYDDPNTSEDVLFLGQLDNPNGNNSQVDNFFRHFSFGGEFLLGKKENFRIRAAYQHRGRGELKVTNYRGLSGFSYGIGLKVNRFHFDFGRYTQHLAGGYSHLTITTGIQDFKTKKLVED